MDRQLIIDTVQALRDELHRQIKGIKSDDHWDVLQSADHLLEKMAAAIVTDQILVNSTLNLAIPYVSEVARFRGMMEILGQRYNWLNSPYLKTSVGIEDLATAGRDFWLMYNLMKETNGTIESSRIPGSVSESGPGGHVQQGSE